MNIQTYKKNIFFDQFLKETDQANKIIRLKSIGIEKRRVMDLPIVQLSSFSNMAAIVLEENNEKLSRCMQIFAKNKENIRIVTNTQSFPLYETFQNVQTIYDPEKYDYIQGTTFLFDNCFTDMEWTKDKKLLDFISYPKMFGFTTVFGFRQFPAISARMCWNLDLLCIGENLSTDTRKKIYERFFLYRFSYNEFCEILEHCTKENRFLVLRREGIDDVLYQTN